MIETVVVIPDFMAVAVAIAMIVAMAIAVMRGIIVQNRGNKVISVVSVVEVIIIVVDIRGTVNVVAVDTVCI